MGLNGKGLVDYAKSKKGMFYFYGAKISNGVLTEDFIKAMHKAYPSTVTSAYIKKARNRGQVGKVNTDCSGLIAGYTGKNLGSAQLYQQAQKRLPISNYKDFANGVVVWRSGHVGVFFKENGKYYVVEAKGIDYGVVISDFVPSKWSYGLTFSWMTYEYDKNIAGTSKQQNPYTEPTAVVKKGSKDKKDTGVRWVQWELREAGFDHEFTYKGKAYGPVLIDGDAGKITDAAIRAFQASCKITVDGKVGATTRKYLRNNV